MADKDILTAEQAFERFGVSVHMKGMIPKGQAEVHEFRGALRMPGGISSSLTVVVKSWMQSAHYHRHACENTTVLAGQVVYFVCTGGNLVVRPYFVGDVMSDLIRKPHTLYVTEGTVLSSAKWAQDPYEGSDWHASAELDAKLSGLSEAQVLEWAQVSRDEFFKHI